LSPVRGVAIGCAALASADALSAAALSADDLSLDDLSLDDLPVDFPSAFELDDLLALGRGPSVLSSEPGGALSPGCPRLVDGSFVWSAADVVSREDLSDAVSLLVRCEDDGSEAWVGALVGSGWILLSTSAAKLSLACDGSRPLGFTGAL
jgi:hypothetical protein